MAPVSGSNIVKPVILVEMSSPKIISE
jgi:hypothetical protein